MKPTKDQIAAEIAALKKLTPVGRFAGKTQETIRVQIEELEFGFDQTAAEWNELSDEDQMAVQDAINWKSGEDDTPPSKTFGGLVG